MRNLGFDNYKFFWYGSGIFNFIGILYRGLLVVFIGISIIGYLFGEVRYN